ncbi:ATP-binding protein [Saccharothrix sp. NRRL B-16314]|uniref:ATP-binding protein n=1 Tax=Saccharothrix sp. NRRL B-16314 TaxID=1463825 RepID=UPI00052496A2|nr:tetratricopeptide repeat protein [Saccharothrix sp. NRRL B-16314]
MFPIDPRGNRDERFGETHSQMSGSSRDVVQAASISGGVHIHHGVADVLAPAGEGPPRQLPAELRIFVNRVEEIRNLAELISGGSDQPVGGAVQIISGTAGAGKTALALRYAHHLADRFPDGQLYVNLRGYDPGVPLAPFTALSRFLVALGVPSAAIPDDVEIAAAMYRSLLANRTMLVVLDNAATAAQVRPLIPGGSRCLTIVTSRSQLSGLAIHDGARRVTIGRLTESDSVKLLQEVMTGYRPADGVEQLAELARLCARLPIALRIAAERAAIHPRQPLAGLIEELRDESALWDALSVGDMGEEDSVRPVFAWSYRALSAECSQLFRLLGMHPGYEFGIDSAAALAGTSVRRARQLLDRLVTMHVIEQTTPGRYEMHDLLRAFSIEQLQVEERPETRAAALERVLDWYLRAADAAQALIMPQRNRVAIGPPRHDIVVQPFAGYDAAVDWAEHEHGNFLPAVQVAVKHGFDRHAWQLALVLWSAKAPSTPTAEWLPIGEAGLAAVRRVGDAQGEAALLQSLGFAYVKVNNLSESLKNHRGALEIRRESGDSAGQAETLNALGSAHLRWRQLKAAEEHFAQAQSLYRELGSVHWGAVVLGNLATVRHQAGRYAEAAADIEQVLAVHQAQGNKRGIGNALHLLGRIHLDQGNAGEALRVAQQAVELALDLRSHVLEGYWLLTLADAQVALGRPAEALPSYQRSAVLHRRLGDRIRESLAWHGAGTAYRRLGREDEAADFHRSGIAVFREVGHTWYEAMSLNGLAAALRDSDAGLSVVHWNAALRLLADHDDPRAVGIRRRIEGHLAETRD